MSVLALVVALSMPPMTVTKDVSYSKAGGADLQMDLYYPADYVKKPSPAVLVVHGGAWVAGKRQDMADIAETLARNGFFAATTSYRLAPKFKYPAMVDDVQTAVRFLRANSKKFGIDPKRIGACGASAGGHLSLLLGTTDTRDPMPREYAGHSSRVSAVFDFFGPVDMTVVGDYPKTLDPVFQQVLGKKREDATAEIKAASPFYYVTKDDAPVFIFQGTIDPLVNMRQSKMLEKRYRELGIPVEAHYLEGVGHAVPMNRKDVRNALSAGIAFLRKWLR